MSHSPGQRHGPRILASVHPPSGPPPAPDGAPRRSTHRAARRVAAHIAYRAIVFHCDRRRRRTNKGSRPDPTLRIGMDSPCPPTLAADAVPRARPGIRLQLRLRDQARAPDSRSTHPLLIVSSLARISILTGRIRPLNTPTPSPQSRFLVAFALSQCRRATRAKPGLPTLRHGGRRNA